MEKEEIEVFDVFVASAGGGIAPALVLRNEDKYLPIYVGFSEAISANKGLKNEESFRPLAHDVILDFLDNREIELKEIIIDDLKEGVYFAQIILNKNGEEIKIDARPSDSIALAVRKEKNLFIKKDIFEEASKDIENIKEKMESLDKYLG